MTGSSHPPPWVYGCYNDTLKWQGRSVSLEIYKVHWVLALLLSFWWGDDFSPWWFWLWRGQTSSNSSKSHFIVTAFPRGLRTDNGLAGRPAIKLCSKQMPGWWGKNGWNRLSVLWQCPGTVNQADNLVHFRKLRHRCGCYRVRRRSKRKISIWHTKFLVLKPFPCSAFRPEVSGASSRTHYPSLATRTMPYIQMNILNLFQM